MNRHLLIALVLLLSGFVASGCGPQTVYLVQQPDGTLVQTETPPAAAGNGSEIQQNKATGEQAANGNPVILVQNADGTLSPVAMNPDGTPVVVAQDGTAQANPDGTVTVNVDPRKPVQIDDDVVILDVLMSNDFMMVDNGGPMFMQITLGARELEHHSRAPLNVALVIDRSGSMSGQKIRDVKKAAGWLVDNLAEEDRVSVISYASDVRVDASSMLDVRGRRGLHRAIERIEDGGGTFLSGGLETGAMQIMETFDEDSLSRVILLSDGNANEGITDPRELSRVADKFRENGVPISTMGVGVDYNEDLMADLAIAGGGDYYFIEASQNVAGIFEKELVAIGNTVIRDAVIELEIPDGVKVNQVFGYQHEIEGDTLRVFMNSVSAGKTKRLLLSFDVPSNRAGEVVVARPAIAFHNQIEGKDQRQGFEDVTLMVTNDRRQVKSAVNHDVIEKVELVRNAQARKQVFAKLDAGDRKGAMEVVKQRKKEARRANDMVQSEALEQDLDELANLEKTVEDVPEDKEKARRHRSSRDFKASKKSSKAAAVDAIVY